METLKSKKFEQQKIPLDVDEEREWSVYLEVYMSSR